MLGFFRLPLGPRIPSAWTDRADGRPQPPDDCIGMRSGVLLADIGSIHRWNPAVVDSRMTSEREVGIGSSRRCELGGKNYLDEEVVEWIQKKILTMRIVATNLPFKEANIRFALEDHGEQTLVAVAPTYRLNLVCWALRWPWFSSALSTEKG